HPADRAGDAATDDVCEARAERSARSELTDVELDLQPLLVTHQLCSEHAGDNSSDSPGPCLVDEGSGNGALGEAERPPLPAERQVDDSDLSDDNRNGEDERRPPGDVAPAGECRRDGTCDERDRREEAYSGGGGHPSPHS